MPDPDVVYLVFEEPLTATRKRFAAEFDQRYGDTIDSITEGPYGWQIEAKVIHADKLEAKLKEVSDVLGIPAVKISWTPAS
jgi:hypothetical protein